MSEIRVSNNDTTTVSSTGSLSKTKFTINRSGIEPLINNLTGKMILTSGNLKNELTVVSFPKSLYSTEISISTTSEAKNSKRIGSETHVHKIKIEALIDNIFKNGYVSDKDPQ